MRVDIYVDGYNLYYGGRHLAGSGSAHRKWLDVRGLVSDIVGAQRGWPGASIERLVYCTARIDARINPEGHAEQDVYLKALLASASVDHIEYGTYVTGARQRPLAVRGAAQLVDTLSGNIDAATSPRTSSPPRPVGTPGHRSGELRWVHNSPGPSWAGFFRLRPEAGTGRGRHPAG